MSLFAALQSLAAQQQVATGMVVAALAGTAAFSLKAVPGHAWKGAKDLFSVTLCVEGRDRLYRDLGIWLARGGAAKQSQRLMVEEDFDYDEGRWRWAITLGLGWHLIWVDGRPLLVNRSVSEGGDLAKLIGDGASKKLWLVSLGRSQALIRRIVDEAERIASSDGLVQVNFWQGGGYMLADRRQPRALDTLFMPAAQKAALIADVQAFLEARETYRKRGTPWRRGYLFEGRPGTGKTSLIFAMASALGRSIYLINLASVSSDNELMMAFNQVDWNGVVLIEDIDAAEISKDRQLVSAEREAKSVVPGAQPQKLTLSGLLNAIDGVGAREGRLLFATTNHPEKLDPALLRPGRFDVREAITPLDRESAMAMFTAFDGPARLGVNAWRRIEARLPMPAAELQNLLQQPEAAPAIEAAA